MIKFNIKGERIRNFRCDLIAALTVTVILIPQGMAYSLLAGLSPIYGLYTAMASMLIYPIFATSRELSVGPVALTSIIVLSSVSVFAEPGTSEFLNLVLLVTLMSGVLQILYSILNVGALAKFLSYPVLSGFISAAGIIIALSQVKTLLGVRTPRTSTVPEMLIVLGDCIGDTNVYSLLFGLLGLILILVLKRISKKIPSAILVVILGSLAVKFFRLEDQNIEIVGDLPKGLPTFYADFLDFSRIYELLPSAFVISIICFIGSYAIAKSLAENKYYEIISNKELLGLGMAKVVSSFFLSFPSSGSFTRSAINNDAGAKTKLAGVYAAILVGITLLFLSHWFYFLPEPVLAAIIIASVFSLINYKHAKDLFHTDRKDFTVMLSTFVLTLILGIQNGVIAGILISFLMLIRNASKSKYAIMGHVGSGEYRDISRYKDATILPHVLIFRYDNNLYFANSEHFCQSIMLELSKYEKPAWLILNFSSITNIDSTGIQYLRKLGDDLERKNIDVKTANVKGAVRDLFMKNKLYDIFDSSESYESVAAAVTSIESSK